MTAATARLDPPSPVRRPVLAVLRPRPRVAANWHGDPAITRRLAGPLAQTPARRRRRV